MSSTQCVLCAVFYRNKLTSGNRDGIRGEIRPKGERDSRTVRLTPAMIADACRPKIRLSHLLSRKTDELLVR